MYMLSAILNLKLKMKTRVNNPCFFHKKWKRFHKIRLVYYTRFFSFCQAICSWKRFQNGLVNIIYFIGSSWNVSVFIPHCKRFHRVCKRFHQVNIIFFMGSSVWVDRTPTRFPSGGSGPDRTFTTQAAAARSGVFSPQSSSRSQASAQATLK